MNVTIEEICQLLGPANLAKDLELFALRRELVAARAEIERLKAEKTEAKPDEGSPP